MATAAVTTAAPTSTPATIFAVRPGCSARSGCGDGVGDTSGGGSGGGGLSGSLRATTGACSGSSVATTSCDPPARSSTLRVNVWRPGIDTVSACGPGDRSRSVTGVRPYGCPSTVTLAPDGSDVTV